MLPPSTTPAFGTAAATEERFLMGPGQLDSWLDEADTLRLSQPMPDHAAPTDLWRAGQAEYARLEASEAGATDRPTVKPLPKVMDKHITALIEIGGLAGHSTLCPSLSAWCRWMP